MPYIPLAILSSGIAVLGLVAYKVLRGPRCRSDRDQCRAAVIGDSITAGRWYVNLLERNLPQYSFDVYGGVGYGTNRLLRIMRDEIAPKKYDEVIIQGGLNDIGRNDAENYIINNLREMVSVAKKSGARVILLSLTPWNRSTSKIKSINKTLFIRSHFWGVDDYINVWRPLADERGGLKQEYIGDPVMGVHPNQAGHRIIGGRILEDAY